MRKRRLPEPPNHDRWLVSYADFITLLFAFFTTMYAISTIDAQKWGRMVIAMSAAFNSDMFPSGSDRLSLGKGGEAGTPLSRDLTEHVVAPGDKALKEYSIKGFEDLKTNFLPDALPKGEVVMLEKFKQDLDALIISRSLMTKVRTRLDPRGLVITLGEGGSCFDSGSDQLNAEGRELLKVLAPQLLARKSQIEIEGHTDNVPIQTVRFPSNWELSTARATAILHYLVKSYGFAPQQLRATGYGEYCPIAPNDTPEGRARNRRTDLVVLNTGYSRIGRR